MSGRAFDDHWFDRFARRQTRGQVLKAALAGAALTLPFARSATGHAANRTRRSATCKAENPTNDPMACFGGCDWAAHIQHQQAVSACNAKFNAHWVGSALVGLFLNPVGGLLAQGASLALALACQDHANLAQKAMGLDCLTPNCPGFDPCARGGPCDNLPSGALCCPDAASLQGYVPCAQCCNPQGKGCGSGCTDCNLPCK